MNSEIVDAFARIRRDTPHRPLVWIPATDTRVTAADLWEAAERVNRRLDAAKVNPCGLVVAALGNRLAYLATFLACRMRQQPLCPLDGSTTPTETKAIAEQLGASVVLTPGPTTVASSQVDQWAVTARMAIPDAGDCRHGTAALLKMTSGSSGAPRATLTPEEALITDTRTLMSAMHVGADDIQMAAIPFSHAYGISNLVVPLFIQGTPIVMRETFVPHRFADDVRRYGVRAFPGVPFMFDHFNKNPPAGGWPPRLQNLVSAGAALETHVAERFQRQFGVKIHPFYGTSETGGISYDATDGPLVEGMVGTALPNVILELVPHEGAPDSGGRVLVRGPSVIQSYADHVDSENFIDGGFLTGDLGVLDARGQLTLSGRVSSFVNVAGRKVQPHEVERVLRAFHGIVDVRVVGLTDERRGEQLVACLVVSGAKPSLMKLRQFCGRQLAAHKIPRAFVVLDAIPLTERGKTDRIRLRDAARAALSTATNML